MKYERDEPEADMVRFRQGGGTPRYEVIRYVIPPRHQRASFNGRPGRMLAPRARWLAYWEELPVRSEVKATADVLTEREDWYPGGYPRRARTTALMAEDTGRSARTIERFIKTAGRHGMLTEADRQVLTPGMRATPHWALTVPCEETPAPESLNDEMDAFVQLSEDGEFEGGGWITDPQSPPPSWVPER